MNTNSEYLVHARSLQADIIAAPGVWLPRRELLLEWLTGFVSRASAPRYELEENEASDLRAVDQLLRTLNVRAA